jgi:riboflavin synthase
MFTGIIEAIGTIRALERRSASARLRLAVRWRADAPPGVQLGDSVAVNGVCLTVVAQRVEAAEAVLDFDVSHESLARTGLGRLRAGARVNLERALRVGDRLGGHWVTGHVDGVGRLASVRRNGEAWDVRVTAPAALLPELVGKGSVAIDGASLTVNQVHEDGFSVTLIPHTVAETTLLDGGEGGEVNLETDLLVKAVRRAIAAAVPGGAGGGARLGLREGG